MQTRYFFSLTKIIDCFQSDAVLYRTCPDLMRRLLHLHRQRKQQQELKEVADDEREMLAVWKKLLAVLDRIR